MPSRIVEIHPLAAKEASLAYRWYGRRSPGTAARFNQAVQVALGDLAADAERGSPYGRLFRWLRVRGFPYLVYYEIRDPRPVIVYAIAHSRRRPGYWLRRRK